MSSKVNEVGLRCGYRSLISGAGMIDGLGRCCIVPEGIEKKKLNEITSSSQMLSRTYCMMT